MSFIGDDCWKIIYDYKNQLEITDKFNKCIEEVDNIYHSVIYNGSVRNIEGKLVSYLYNQRNSINRIIIINGRGTIIEISEY